MDAKWGWALAALAVASGWWVYGGAGIALALTVVVFWLLLQFGRALRVMKNAAAAPKGQVASAVMLHSKLRPGLTMMQLLPLAGSLAHKLETPAGAPEQFSWADASGAQLLLSFEAGKLSHWQLQRPSS